MQTDQAITRFNLGDREFCFYLPDLDDPLQQTIRETRAFHELDMLADMILRIAPGDLIVDCGANIGNHTVFLAKAAEATVIAVEPSKHCFEILDRNIALNDLDNRVLAVPLACGAKNETGTIIPGPQGYPSQARVAANVRGMGAEVKITPLDELQLPAPVRMLRIDMLGMEADILRGASNILEKDAPTIYAKAQDDQALNEISMVIEPFGYAPTIAFHALSAYRFEKQ